MSLVYILLGSNEGDMLTLLNKAKQQITKYAGNVLKISSIYKTEPWNFETKKKFLNQVILIKTNLNPNVLLEKLLEIEKLLGRERTKQKYTSRTIDIDILLFDDLIINTATLTIPHPLMHERKFVLVPLSEIAGNISHPIINKTIYQLLAECKDQKKVNLL